MWFSLLRRITRRKTKISDLVRRKSRVSYPVDSPLPCKKLERVHRGLVILNQVDRHR